MNTPGIIKYPFWQMTARNPQAKYVCINQGQSYVCTHSVQSSTKSTKGLSTRQKFPLCGFSAA